MTLSPTTRSTVSRGRHRASKDRGDLYALLDAGLLCHLALVHDGAPVVIPTTYGRQENTLYLHGSTGARSLRAAADGVDICVAVTLVDGVVYARSVFHHSMNYRSAVVHGRATPVTDEAGKLRALEVITENAAPGSWSHARQPTGRELAATAVLALDLTESSVKIRSGPPADDEEDMTSAAWAGVLPLRQVWGAPQACPQLPADTPVPPHVTARPSPSTHLVGGEGAPTGVAGGRSDQDGAGLVE